MMRRTGSMTAALVVLVLLISPCIYGRKFSDVHEIKVARLLNRLNKPALKSIKSEDGDIIDCVLITSQPAFDHPLLRNHTIQMRPTFIPKADSKLTDEKEANVIAQVWHKSGECPENTVPIRRIIKKDILRAKSIESFGGKKDRLSDLSRGHEHVVMYTKNGHFFGTKFVTNIWRPKVKENEMSLAQTWVQSGNRSTPNSIEAGWQVYPGLYDDHNPRLFVYWTTDGYHNGCYNLLCPGFVQTSSIFAVGGSFNSVSQYDGPQYEVSMHIWKDNKNWWLKIGEELIGYWPGKLFNSFGDGATSISWGGEIYNSKARGGRHTTTDMGSGHFADEGVEKTSYFRNIMTVDGANILREPQKPGLISENVTCYNGKEGNGGTPLGTHFYYGGPGRNSKCH